VAGDCLPVGLFPADEQRLYPAPQPVQRMMVAQHAAEADEPEHVANYIEVTIHLCLANPQLIEFTESKQPVPILYQNLDCGFALAKYIAGISPLANLKWRFYLIDETLLN
jgi:hypothetical protein